MKNNIYTNLSERDVQKEVLLNKFRDEEKSFKLINKEEYSNYVNFKNNLNKDIHN